MEKKAWRTIGNCSLENNFDHQISRTRATDGQSAVIYYGTLKYYLNENYGSYSQMVHSAKQYMNENYSQKISIDDIAKHCFVSQFHFSRIFKLYTSVSPHQYLLNIRLHQAERLTRDTDLPITDICFMTGFNSLDYFSAAFARKYSLSPKKFRMIGQVTIQ